MKKPKGNPDSKGEGEEMRSYSDLPLEMVENIIGRLRLIDRIRLRGVCKDWSALSRQIQPSVDKYPWAMRSFWWPPDHSNDEIYGYCMLTDPPVREEYAVEKQGAVVRGNEYWFLWFARPRASSYGWLLFEHVSFESVLFLYSPFTRQVIKLPELKNSNIRVATFSLDATSTKCVIFTLEYSGGNSDKIRINICCPGDKSWKTYQSWYNNPPVAAAYANGNFYCVFQDGELGAFNVGVEEWTWLTLEGLPFGFDYNFVQLIVCDGNLQLMGWTPLAKGNSILKLLKFDFCERCWVNQINLENRVLFIGCTSFSCPAVGEISELR